MKIEKVILQNIGVYANRNEFDLRADKPIILIGGMNGRGKTTFLESILLALYGRRFRESGQSGTELEQYLRKISNVTGRDRECFIEIAFTVQEQEMAAYRIRREWDPTRKNIRMITRVYKNGAEDKALSENWDMFVEEILPRAIASFFFFDGEKLAELAASKNDEHIRSSIISLLGIDIIEQLIADLHTVVTANQKQLAENRYEERLNELDGQLEEVRKLTEQKEAQLQAAKEKLSELERECAALRDEYAITGGHYTEYREKYEKEREQLLTELDEKKEQLQMLALGSLPLKMVSFLLEDVRQGSEGEKEQGQLQVFVEQFPTLFQEYSGGQAPSGEWQNFLESIKEKVTEDQAVYRLDDDAREHLSGLPAVLAREEQEAEQLIRDRRQLNQKRETVENYLAVKVDDERLAELNDSLIKKMAERTACQAQNETLERELRELKDQTEGVVRMRRQVLQQVVSELDAADDAVRVVSYAQKQIGILETYKVRLQTLKTDMLAAQMTVCLKKLMAKDGLIERIALDGRTLEFHYFNRNGEEIDRQMLSSGEKQLLVIAMLWALGICSKLQFPLIIDTPLARLDSVHRASLIENYFPRASEQVIILSTDQEITYQDYQNLKKHLGREYLLVYDETTMSSSVCQGYFRGDEI